MNRLTRSNAFLLVLLSLSSAAVDGCSPNSNPRIAPAMQRMQRAYQSAQSATTLDDFRARLEELRSATAAARGEALEGEASAVTTYRDGMAELAASFPAVDRAVANGDLAGAKAALGAMDQLRRRYHISLGL